MAKTYFEAHITILSQHPESVKRFVDRIPRGPGEPIWKFSVIDGDPTLGPGIKCYATTHWKSSIAYEEAIRRLTEASRFISRSGFQVVRDKVEHVIYDTRSSTVSLGSCDGACPECHLDDLVPA